jgi:AcrR family transcriptional regulator
MTTPYQHERVRKATGTRRSRAEARQKLLDAGASLFAEQGVEAVNSNVIARAAGVGVGTFYANFEDKHALHRAVVLSGIDSLQQALGRAARATLTSPLEDQVRAMVTAAVLFAEQQPLLFKVAFGSVSAGGGASRPAMGFSPRAMEHRLAELQAAGEIDPQIDPGLAARGYLGMQTAVLLAWLEGPDRASREAVIETLSRLHPALLGR